MLFNPYLAEEPWGLNDYGYERLASSNMGGSQPVDFTSMSQNVFSPALSDITPSETPVHSAGSLLPDINSDDPPIIDYDDFEDLDGAFDDGHDLFGGIGIGVDEGSEVESWSTNTPLARSPRHSPPRFACPLRSPPHSPERSSRRPHTPNFSPMLSSPSPILSN